jgi:hypothetical protein
MQRRKIRFYLKCRPEGTQSALGHGFLSEMASRWDSGWIPASAGMTRGWIPASAGMTKPANPDSGWIPASAGMTRGWIPASAGMTRHF